MNPPDPAEIRKSIAALDPTEKKVLGGMIVVMIRNAPRVKDREWVAENFTRLSVGALGLDEEGEVDSDVQAVEAFVERSINPVLNVAFPLFAQVATDMQAQSGTGQFSLESACAQALTYFDAE